MAPAPAGRYAAEAERSLRKISCSRLPCFFFGLCYCTSQCTERMGANAEEEEINGKTMWVHYVR